MCPMACCCLTMGEMALAEVTFKKQDMSAAPGTGGNGGQGGTQQYREPNNFAAAFQGFKTRVSESQTGVVAHPQRLLHVSHG